MAARAEAFRGRTASEWSERRGAAGIPAAAVRDLVGAFGTPQVAAYGLISAIAHPTAGQVRTVTSPVRFDDEAPRPYRPPLRHGEHTREIRAEAGYRVEQIAARQADGTAGPLPPR